MTRPARFNWKLPLLLYLVTWLTTTFCRIDFGNDTLSSFLLALCLGIAGTDSAPLHWHVFCGHLWNALQFSTALMLILTCHELTLYSIVPLPVTEQSSVFSADALWTARNLRCSHRHER